MKKFFTYLSMAVIGMTALTSKAEEVTATIESSVYDWDKGEYTLQLKGEFKLNIIANQDGSYTIENFLNSDAPFTFSFNENDALTDSYGSALTILSKHEYEWDADTQDYSDEDPYLLTPAGDAIEGTIDYGTDGKFTIIDPYIYTDSYYTYVMASEGGWGKSHPEKYYAYLYLGGWDADDNDAYVECSFYFNGASDSSSVAELAADKNAPVEYYNINGIRVDNPSNGLFIRKQGGEVKKVIIK